MSDLRATRLSLHAVAELLLAGPQLRTRATIQLRPTRGVWARSARGLARLTTALLGPAHGEGSSRVAHNDGSVNGSA